MSSKRSKRKSDRTCDIGTGAVTRVLSRLKILNGAMGFTDRMRMGLPVKSVAIVALILGVGMRVGSPKKIFFSALKLLGEDVRYEWGIFCLQEGQKNCSAEIIRQDGFLFSRVDGTARGAPTICLCKQMGQFFGEARFGREFVALWLDMVPQVLVWTCTIVEALIVPEAATWSTMVMHTPIF